MLRKGVLVKRCAHRSKYVKSFKRYSSRPRKPRKPRYLGDVIHDRKRYLSPSLATFQAFQEPFAPVTSKMQYMYDADGNKYLDLLAQNLTISVGHAHPRVMKAVQDNFDNGMVHCTTMYYNEKPVEAAKKLVATLPKIDDDEWVVHFVNSGSEAVDLAMLMARSYTGAKDVLAMRNSYHGLHGPAMGVTGMSVCKNTHQQDSNVKHVMNPDIYQGPLANKHIPVKEQIEIYADDVKRTIEYETPGNIAGFLFEQVQGYGGIHILPDGYMSQIAEHVRDAGGLIIADEVQTGFGRMGNGRFWSFEMFDQLDDFVPDIVVTAKGLGNGFPIAAVMVKRKIAESMLYHRFFNTYGGNPTVCSAASAVLDIVHTDKHLQTVDNVGKKLTKVLQQTREKYPSLIGDLRGSGLMHGIEFNDPEKATMFFEKLRDRRLIFGLGGYYKNVLRVMPPMCISRKDVDNIENVLCDVLDEHV